MLAKGTPVVLLLVAVGVTSVHGLLNLRSRGHGNVAANQYGNAAPNPYGTSHCLLANCYDRLRHPMEIEMGDCVSSYTRNSSTHPYWYLHPLTKRAEGFYEIQGPRGNLESVWGRGQRVILGKVTSRKNKAVHNNPFQYWKKITGPAYHILLQNVITGDCLSAGEAFATLEACDLSNYSQHWLEAPVKIDDKLTPAPHNYNAYKEEYPAYSAHKEGYPAYTATKEEYPFHILPLTLSDNSLGPYEYKLE